MHHFCLRCRAPGPTRDQHSLFRDEQKKYLIFFLLFFSSSFYHHHHHHNHRRRRYYYYYYHHHHHYHYEGSSMFFYADILAIWAVGLLLSAELLEATGGANPELTTLV